MPTVLDSSHQIIKEKRWGGSVAVWSTSCNLHNCLPTKYERGNSERKDRVYYFTCKLPCNWFDHITPHYLMRLHSGFMGRQH